MKTFTFTLIVAKARNNAIGKNNRMPWHLPGDLKFFKQETFGKPVLMGRKTFESIGRPLPGRRNIVLTRDQGWKREGVEVVHHLADVAELPNLDEDVFVIGGAELYRQTIRLDAKTQRLIVTEIDREFDGDAFFPEIDPNIWEIEERSAVQHEGDIEYTFVKYRRRR